MRKLAGLIGLMAMGMAAAGPLPDTAFRKTPYVGAIAVDRRGRFSSRTMQTSLHGRRA